MIGMMLPEVAPWNEPDPTPDPSGKEHRISASETLRWLEDKYGKFVGIRLWLNSSKEQYQVRQNDKLLGAGQTWDEALLDTGAKEEDIQEIIRKRPAGFNEDL